jgi:hypothetical protein
LNTDQTLKLKLAIDADLRLKNYRVNARKSDALIDFFKTYESCLRFADDGAITFNGNALSVALAQMLAMPDAREYLGVVDADPNL